MNKKNPNKQTNKNREKKPNKTATDIKAYGVIVVCNITPSWQQNQGGVLSIWYLWWKNIQWIKLMVKRVCGLQIAGCSMAVYKVLTDAIRNRLLCRASNKHVKNKTKWIWFNTACNNSLFDVVCNLVGIPDIPPLLSLQILNSNRLWSSSHRKALNTLFSKVLTVIFSCYSLNTISWPLLHSFDWAFISVSKVMYNALRDSPS